MKLTEESKKALFCWWCWLDDNRGDRAVLRRAEKPDDVLLTPAFAHFLQKMPDEWSDNSQIRLTDAALVAAVIARVKKQRDEGFAKSLALGKKKESKAAMSELRFQQLQKSHSPEEFFTRLRRAVDLLDRAVNITSLANDILHWLGEHRFGPASRPHERLAVRWASDYYANLKD